MLKLNIKIMLIAIMVISILANVQGFNWLQSWSVENKYAYGMLIVACLGNFLGVYLTYRFDTLTENSKKLTWAIGSMLITPIWIVNTIRIIIKR